MPVPQWAAVTAHSAATSVAPHPPGLLLPRNTTGTNHGNLHNTSRSRPVAVRCRGEGVPAPGDGRAPHHPGPLPPAGAARAHHRAARLGHCRQGWGDVETKPVRNRKYKRELMVKRTHGETEVGGGGLCKNNGTCIKWLHLTQRVCCAGKASVASSISKCSRPPGLLQQL